MRFCIATVEFWHSVGFDTEHWRKSTDGKKAMCHEKFALTLVDKDNVKMTIYDIDSAEFKKIIEEEFTNVDDIV